MLGHDADLVEHEDCAPARHHEEPWIAPEKTRRHEAEAGQRSRDGGRMDVPAEHPQRIGVVSREEAARLPDEPGVGCQADDDGDNAMWQPAADPSRHSWPTSDAGCDHQCRQAGHRRQRQRPPVDLCPRHRPVTVRRQPGEQVEAEQGPQHRQWNHARGSNTTASAPVHRQCQRRQAGKQHAVEASEHQQPQQNPGYGCEELVVILMRPRHRQQPGQQKSLREHFGVGNPRVPHLHDMDGQQSRRRSAGGVSDQSRTQEVQGQDAQDGPDRRRVPGAGEPGHLVPYGDGR